MKRNNPILLLALILGLSPAHNFSNTFASSLKAPSSRLSSDSKAIFSSKFTRACIICGVYVKQRACPLSRGTLHRMLYMESASEIGLRR